MRTKRGATLNNKRKGNEKENGKKMIVPQG
jgi:hypothetical protein